jgi:hypothetical protein
LDVTSWFDGVVKRYDRFFEVGVYTRQASTEKSALSLRVLINESVKVSWKQFVQVVNHDVGTIIPETVRLSMAIDTDD